MNNEIKELIAATSLNIAEAKALELGLIALFAKKKKQFLESKRKLKAANISEKWRELTGEPLSNEDISELEKMIK